MTFPVVGSNIPSAYQISNSLRFNDDDSPYLSRTPSASNTKTWTWSAWIKRGDLGFQVLFRANLSTTIYTYFSFNSNDTFRFFTNQGTDNCTTNAVFRDFSAWYHFVGAIDTTQANASDRVKIYVNGELQTLSTANYPSLNFDTEINKNTIHHINGEGSFDGYMSEINFIDGQQLSPTDFGEFDEDSGVWKPKQYAGTYGTNGFYLKFNNTGNMGEDSSGNDNTWSPTNLSGTTDVTTDTPTNNFATLNPLTFDSSGMTFSEGNTKVIGVAGSNSTAVSTQSFSSGKWYAEFKIGNTHKTRLGAKGTDWYDKNNTQIGTVYDQAGYIYIGTQESGSDDLTPPSYTTGDIIGVFVDKDNNTIKFSKNGTVHSVSQTLSQNEYAFYVFDYSGVGDNQLSVEANFGNPSFSISSGNSDVNGYGNFEYSPNDGTYDYLALCTQNLATALSPTIDDGSQYFNTVLYSGDGTSDHDITGVGFNPDWTWIKNRSASAGHALHDTSRGDQQRLSSDDSAAESTNTNFGSFITDGFNLGGSGGSYNTSGNNYASWNWLANGGTTSSNTDGSITATLQSNATSGFAIATWSGTGTAGTIGHNLGVAPKLVIVKRRNSPANSWAVQHSDLASDFVTFLNRSDTGGETDSTMFNGTHPTSSVFSVGTHAGTNQSGGTYVGYIFAPITGYSAMGKYTGNGDANGTYVSLGFRPQFIIVKRTDSTGNWHLVDNKRNGFNVDNDVLLADTSDSEFDVTQYDILSNGFKLRSTANSNNASGGTYIYMAFAENPFVTSGATPVTAR